MTDGSPPPEAPDPRRPAPELDRAASREELEIGTEWRPYERQRLRKVVRSGELVERVQVHWEELVVEPVELTPVERLALPSGLARRQDNLPDVEGEVEIVLLREEVLVETRLVPYQRVRARRDLIEEQLIVREELRRDSIATDQPAPAPLQDRE